MGSTIMEKTTAHLPLSSLCAQWRTQQDFDTFAKIVSYSLDEGIVEPGDLRDHLGIMPAAVLVWAENKGAPHPLKQQEVVAFINAQANLLPTSSDETTAQKKAATENLRTRINLNNPQRA